MPRKTKAYWRNSVASDVSWWKPGYVFSPRQGYLGARDETMEWGERRLAGPSASLSSWLPVCTMREPRESGTLSRAGPTLWLARSSAPSAPRGISALLVALTYPGRRRAAAWQLRWPFITFVALAATFGLWLLLVAVAMYADTGKIPGWIHAPWLKPILASLLHDMSEKRTVGLCAMLFLMAWNLYLLRAVYLCATGLCLGPLTATRCCRPSPPRWRRVRWLSGVCCSQRTTSPA